MLGAGWLAIYPILCLGWIVIWGGLYEIRIVGHGPSVPVFIFLAAFSISGTVDANWRHWLVWAARKRYRRNDGVLDDRGRRLMRQSQLNDFTTVLQICIGVIAAALFG
jgi:hypothetical protein